MAKENIEIEARFLEIDEVGLKQKLVALGAEDFGPDLFEEIISYSEGWLDYKRKFVKLRKTKNEVFLTYKHQHADAIDGTEEIEIKVNDFDKAKLLLEKMGFGFFMRFQQKKRHSFKLGGVSVDIDTWPKIPTYVELEGESEQAIKDAAKKLGLDWSKAVFENPRIVIEKYYHLPLASYTYFTFDRVE